MVKSLLDIISEDLSWREAELGSLKLLLSRRDVSEHQKTVLLRASWALLYAHYEGFFKTSLTVFYDFAKDSVERCGVLPVKTKLFALERQLKKLRGLPSEAFLNELEVFSERFCDADPTFPDVDTKSNLWPNVLEELLADADISLKALETHKAKIATLVNRRNNISHGKRDIVSEVSYYRSFEDVVYDLMYEMAFELDARLRLPPYAQ